MGHFQETQLEMEALLLLVSEFAMRAKHDLEMPGEVFFCEQVGDAGDPGAFFTGDLQERGIFAGDFGDGCVAQETYHLAGKAS